MPYSRRHHLTERTHKILELALDVALQSGHTTITPEHIALGLIREGGGVAVSAMFFQHVPLAAVEQALVDHLSTPGAPAAMGDSLSWTLADEVVARARVEARAMGHQYVGTEHFLIALLRDTDGFTSRILASHGFRTETAQAEVLRILGNEPPPPTSPSTSLRSSER